MAKELVTVETNEMVARFNALRDRLGESTTDKATSVRQRLDDRMLQAVEYRLAELIDGVIA